MSLADVFGELAQHAQCLQDQLAERALADRLSELAERGREAAGRGDREEMLAAARVSRLVLDEIAADERAGFVGDTLKACDACLDRLDRPLTPPPA